MSLDPDVQRVAAHFAGTSTNFPTLLAAVEQAEGHIVKAVQCSYPSVTTRTEALSITARSAVHAAFDYLAQQGSSGFVRFWQQRWAPEGATNDPTGLNGNWAGNVERLWRPGTGSTSR